MKIKTTVLVGCGASKRPGLRPAGEKYDSTYFALKRDYAEARDDWYILSAKYGLIKPETLIDDYDVSVGDGVSPDQWHDRVRSSLNCHPDRVDAGRVEVLAGKRYVEPIRDLLDDLPCDVVYPFEEGEFSGIGEQMAWLKEATA